jgi:type II secretory pathway component PulF
MRNVSKVAGVFLLLLAVIFVGSALLLGAAFLVGRGVAYALPTLLIIVLFYGWVAFAFLHYRQGRQEELLFLLAAAVEARAPLVPVLEAYLRERPRGPLREFFVFGLLFFTLPGIYFFLEKWLSFDRKIERLIHVLEDGYTLEEGLRGIRGLASPETAVLITLGHATDRLSLCLRQSTQRRYGAVLLEVLARFFYPFVLVWFLFGVGSFSMTFIFPKLQRIFKEFNTPMPEFSVYMFEAWEFVQENMGLVVLGFLLLLLLVSMLIVSPQARWYCPGFRWFYRRHVQSQILRWLGLLFDAGKTVPEALGVLIGSDYFPDVVHDRLRLARVRVQHGESLANSLREAGLIGNQMIPFVQSAERVHNLPWALGELGEHISNRTVAALRRLSVVIAPALVVVIGLLVGGFVIGMFIPLVDIVESLSHDIP